eukprot:15468717-Alexandrium_andersonii.AAC.1
MQEGGTRGASTGRRKPPNWASSTHGAPVNELPENRQQAVRARRRQLPSVRAAGRGPASAASEIAPKASQRATGEAAAPSGPVVARERRQSGAGSAGHSARPSKSRRSTRPACRALQARDACVPAAGNGRGTLR